MWQDTLNFITQDGINYDGTMPPSVRAHYDTTFYQPFDNYFASSYLSVIIFSIILGTLVLF